MIQLPTPAVSLPSGDNRDQWPLGRIDQPTLTQRTREVSSMGVWDWLTSTKHAASGTPVSSPEEVRERILAANRPTAPFRIVDGQGEGVDFIAEWKIVDAVWYEIFVRAGLKKSFRVMLKLDEAEHEVRARDHEYSLSWSAGVPRLEASVSRTLGQVKSFQFGTAYAFTESFD